MSRQLLRAAVVAVALAACNNSAGDVRRSVADFATTDLKSELDHSGLRVTRSRSMSDPVFRSADGTSFCADGVTVSVYEYESVADRVTASESLDAGGNPPGASVDWVGPPRFYARGRVLVLVTSDEHRITATLRRLLGATLTPHARGIRPGLFPDRCSRSAQ